MKIKIFFILAFILTAALAMPLQVTTQQTASATNGQIVFAQQIGSGGQGANVYTANPDGSHVLQVPLVNIAEDFGIPVWSPDGTMLLISHTIRLDNTGQCCLFQPATVNPDGSSFNQLVPPNPPGASSDGIDCPVWSLDQTRILCGFSGDQPGIFSIRASDGGDPVRLTTNPFANEDLPTSISPDGTRFVFLRYNPGPAHGGPKPFITEHVALFVANMDGSGMRQITPFGLAAPHERASAQWSPDGRKIISETTHGRLFIVYPDGAGLTPINLQVGTQQYFAFQPHWSPDNTRIIFCMFANGEEGIFTSNPDGSDVIQLATTPSFVNLYNGPDWGTHPLAQ
jgi:Tol biopolymer transport system component